MLLCVLLAVHDDLLRLRYERELSAPPGRIGVRIPARQAAMVGECGSLMKEVLVKIMTSGPIKSSTWSRIRGSRARFAAQGMSRCGIERHFISGCALIREPSHVSKRCTPARIDQYQLTIEDGRPRGQFAEGLDHAGQPVGIFRAVA
jgi:hypothetical protein